MNGLQQQQHNHRSENGKPAKTGGKKGLEDIIASGTKVVWNRKQKNTQMEKFKDVIRNKYQVKLDTYWDLHQWSIENYSSFWEEIWHFFGVINSKPYDEVAKNGKGFIDIEWFSGARFNFAENMLRFRDDHDALICVDEEGGEERISYAEMYDEVTLYAAALKKHGLQMGDRVACYMANRKEAVFAMLACASMGAIWGGPLPFYGSKAASNIIRPMAPKFLFTIDRYVDNKVENNILKNLPAIVDSVNSLEKVIIVPTREKTLTMDISDINNSCFLQEFLDSGREPNGTVPELEFEQLPFNYPLYINFTSGTTGSPKGLVHSAGTFLPLLRDFGLHSNCTRNDVILTMYPVGWNLWNLYIGNFALGATVLLYNGCPFFLSPTAFWDLIEKYRVSYSFLVTSIVDKMEKDNIVPDPECDLSCFKMLTIGASPVKLQNFDFIQQKVKSDLYVSCLYGATEAIGVFSGFDLNTPVYSGEIQCPALGVNIKCFDSDGNSVVGEKGELVIATPTPSLPIFMWNDNNKKKLKEIYFSKFPGVWSQSDECWIDPNTKGIVVIGRSDETLNPNGERFGSADIYCAVHSLKEIADCLCVPQNNAKGDQRAVLFIKMSNGHTFSPTFVQRVKKTIENELTIEHVPEVIIETKEIPYNLNGKKMEKIVIKIIENNEVPEVSNIRNPECLKYYCDVPELQGY